MSSSMVKIINENKDFQSFARAYGRHIAKLLEELDVEALNHLALELEDAQKKQKTVFIIGNGGSAATASHMTNDLGFGVREHTDPALRVMSLTDNMSVVTAIANDIGYDQIFLRQLQLCFRPGDKLLVISASGNSANVVIAAQWVKEQGGKVLGFLGFDGGKLKEICDVTVLVKTEKGEYGPVEDVHMILDHLLHTWIWGRTRLQK